MKRLVSFLSVLVLAAGATLFAAANKTMVGQKLPELRLDYVGKKPDVAGKPMILEFWATWWARVGRASRI